MKHRRWTARKVIALLLIGTMTSSGCSSGCRKTAAASQATGEEAGQSSASAGTPAAAATATAASVAIPALDAPATNEALSFIEQIAKQPANAPPDVAAQAASLGRDAAKVFAFVRGEIRYQVYDGVLRGAAGALSGRAANAWDTALLVAELLRQGGFEVRFARGTLPDASASALVNRMFDQAMQPARQTLSAAGLQPPAATAGVADAMRARIGANWTTNTAEVMAALKKAGIALGTEPPVSDATLLAEARDHVWVEYKDGLQWIPVDPVAAARPGGAAAEARETFTEVPEARHHIVTIALDVEQRAGGSVETKPALTLRAPAANLHGQPIMLAHQVDITGSGAWKATPVLLVGDKAVGGTAFGPAGVDTADNSGAGGIGGRLNQMFGGAPASAAELSAVWLDVTMTGPDGRSETVRREVLDRIGPVARAARSEATAPLRPVALTEGRPDGLTAMMACAVTAGPLSPGTLVTRVAAGATLFRDEALRARLASGNTKDIPLDRLKQLSVAASGTLSVLPAAAHLLSQQYAAEASPALGEPILLYEASPRVAIATFGTAAESELPAGAGVSLDLRRNVLRVVGGGVAPASIIAANIARGVLDGAIEDALVAGDAPVVSTVGILAEARAKGIDIAASSSSPAQMAGWSEDARARIRADRSATLAVVAPATAVKVGGEQRAAWWHVDTATGEAVGVIDAGLHGAQFAEHPLVNAFIAGILFTVCLGLTLAVGMKVLNAAFLFIRAAGPDAAAAGQKGWAAAKKTF